MGIIMKYTSHSAAETEEFGRRLGNALPEGSVIALFGDLGAGKTCFTRGFASGMGIACDVYSPTFALVNEYRDGYKTLYHFDMYRISGFEDLYSTGYFDYLDSGASLIIEWSENIESVLPDDCIRITISKSESDESERILEIIGCDDLENTFC